MPRNTFPGEPERRFCTSLSKVKKGGTNTLRDEKKCTEFFEILIPVFSHLLYFTLSASPNLRAPPYNVCQRYLISEYNLNPRKYSKLTSCIQLIVIQPPYRIDSKDIENIFETKPRLCVRRFSGCFYWIDPV